MLNETLVEAAQKIDTVLSCSIAEKKMVIINDPRHKISETETAEFVQILTKLENETSMQILPLQSYDVFIIKLKDGMSIATPKCIDAYYAYHTELVLQGHILTCDMLGVLALSIAKKFTEEEAQGSDIEVALCALKHYGHTFLRLSVGNDALFYDPYFQRVVSESPQKLCVFATQELTKFIKKLYHHIYPLITQTKEVTSDEVLTSGGTVVPINGFDCTYYVYTTQRGAKQNPIPQTPDPTPEDQRIVHIDNTENRLLTQAEYQATLSPFWRVYEQGLLPLTLEGLSCTIL